MGNIQRTSRHLRALVDSLSARGPGGVAVGIDAPRMALPAPEKAG